MTKHKEHNERGAGRKPKYGEKTKTITTRVPASKEKEIKEQIKLLLKKYTKNPG